MMNIHRYYFPGQIVFITQVVRDRQKVFNDPESLDLLKNVLRNVNEVHPFSMLAYVFMPDHFHLLFRPKGSCNFSQIMHSLKRNFTQAYKKKNRISESLSLWQPRFWDHVIRNEDDLENHLHYIHFNPIKHGFVKNPKDWHYSSFLVWKNRGVYDGDEPWVEPENSSWGE